jgi:hypothetical protein
MSIAAPSFGAARSAPRSLVTLVTRLSVPQFAGSIVTPLPSQITLLPESATTVTSTLFPTGYPFGKSISSEEFEAAVFLLTVFVLVEPPSTATLTRSESALEAAPRSYETNNVCALQALVFEQPALNRHVAMAASVRNRVVID